MSISGRGPYRSKKRCITFYKSLFIKYTTDRSVPIQRMSQVRTLMGSVGVWLRPRLFGTTRGHYRHRLEVSCSRCELPHVTLLLLRPRFFVITRILFEPARIPFQHPVNFSLILILDLVILRTVTFNYRMKVYLRYSRLQNRQQVTIQELLPLSRNFYHLELLINNLYNFTRVKCEYTIFFESVPGLYLYLYMYGCIHICMMYIEFVSYFMCILYPFIWFYGCYR